MADRSTLLAITFADDAVKHHQEGLDRTPGDMELYRKHALAEQALRTMILTAVSQPDITWDDIAHTLDVPVTRAMRRFGPRSS